MPTDFPLDLHTVRDSALVVNMSSFSWAIWGDNFSNLYMLGLWMYLPARQFMKHIVRQYPPDCRHQTFAAKRLLNGLVSAADIEILPTRDQFSKTFTSKRTMTMHSWCSWASRHQTLLYTCYTQAQGDCGRQPICFSNVGRNVGVKRQYSEIHGKER